MALRQSTHIIGLLALQGQGPPHATSWSGAWFLHSAPCREQQAVAVVAHALPEHPLEDGPAAIWPLVKAGVKS